MYRYSYYLDQANLPVIPDSNLPYKQVCLYSICTTLILIPYYRWAVPRLLFAKRYWAIIGVVLLILILSPFNSTVFARILALFTVGLPVHSFFEMMGGYIRLDLNLFFTDLLAFSCVAFARFSYKSEQQRHKIETDNLQLQLGMLKAQLQPHFLFNTLNDLYGLSLTGSKDTSRFILLLSQMMQYVLYDCDKETVALNDELNFLKGYFELEQAKFPDSKITFEVDGIAADRTIPPLLFLPLVENSFKHGRYKLEDTGTVEAKMNIADKEIVFIIKNEMLGQQSAKPAKGGIGLINIKKRLELYYPATHTLSFQDDGNYYIATLTMKL